jgi:hypothetical protein
MARKRMIDPSFWDDLNVAKLSIPARLCFIGMVSNADDEGRIEADPRYIKRAVFGFDDDLTSSDITGYLAEIETSCPGVVFYQVDGRALASFSKWKQYQYIQKPQPSRLPAVPVTEQYDTNTVAVSPNRIEENIKELSGGDTRARATSTATTNGHAAAVDQSVTVRLKQDTGLSHSQAVTYATQHNFTPTELDLLAAWAKAKRAQNKNPAAILARDYVPHGDLPDDLPRPKQPGDDFRVYRPDGSLDVAETNRLLKENPGRMLARAG